MNLKNRTDEQREEAIRRRLIAGKMPYARDTVGQPPERIEAWVEHVKNWVAPARPERLVEQVEVELDGKRYRVSGAPTIRKAGYPDVEVWRTQPAIVGRRSNSTGWARIQHGQRRDLVLIKALEKSA